MNDEQIEKLVKAINRHGESIRHLGDCISDEEGSLVEAVFNGLTRAGRLIGNGNASTDMGGLEALGLHIGEGVDGLVDAPNSIGDAIDDKIE